MFCLTFQEVPQNLAIPKTFPYRTVSTEQREYVFFEQNIFFEMGTSFCN
jgi:hypothetical protein